MPPPQRNLLIVPACSIDLLKGENAPVYSRNPIHMIVISYYKIGWHCIVKIFMIQFLWVGECETASEKNDLFIVFLNFWGSEGQTQENGSLWDSVDTI